MIELLTKLILFAACISCVSSALNDSLAYYWPIYCESAKEMVNGLDLTSPNASYITDRLGRPNSAFSVDNSTNYFQAPVANYFGGQFTVTLWFRPRSYPSYGRVFEYTNASLASAFTMQYGAPNGLKAVVSFYYSNSTPASGSSSSANLTMNEWSHLAVSFNRTHAKHYVNGVNTGQKIFPDFPDTPLTYFYFGKSWGSARTDGDFDEIKIFNKVLSDQEILDDMNMTTSYYSTPCLKDSLAYYWPINCQSAKEMINGLDLTSPNPTYVADRLGRPYSAFSVDNSTNYFQAPVANYFGGQFTVTLWFRPRNTPLYSRVFEYTNTSFANAFLMSYGSPTGLKPSVGFMNPNGSNPGGSGSSINLTLNAWNHIAITYNRLTGKHYANGVYAGQKQFSEFPTTQLPYFYFGKSITNSLKTDGDFDEIKIYNKILTTQEILQDMSMTTSYYTAPCLEEYLSYYWPIDCRAAQDVVSSQNLSSPDPLFVQDRFGNANSAFYVQNNLTYFRAPVANYFGGQFTLSIWFKPVVDWPFNARIFEYSNASMSNALIVAYVSTNVGTPTLGFRYVDASYGPASGSGFNLTLSQWNHIAVTYDRKTAKLFLNGVLRISVSYSGFPSTPLSYLNFGYSITGSSISNAVYDEIKIFNRILSIAEIQQDMNKNNSYYSNTCPSGQAPSLNQSLSFYWPIDCGTTQEIIAGRNLSCTAPVYVANRFGNPNSAIHVENVTSFLQAPVANYFGGQFTFSAWIRPYSSSPATSRIFEYSNSSFSNGLSVYYNSQTPAIRFYLSNGTSGAQVGSTVAMTLDTWNHFAISYDRTYARLYVNGNLGAQLEYAGYSTASLATFYFGRSLGGSIFSVIDYDEIKIFNRVLIQAEIQQDMNMATPYYVTICPIVVPQVVIDNKSSNPASPMTLDRSSVYQFNANVNFTCIYNYSIVYEWTIYSIDTSTYQSLGQVSTSFNPTMSTLSFTLPSNTLAYGLFKVVCSANVSAEYNLQSVGSDFTYVLIKPTGITVMGIANGVNNITVGYLQSFTLRPAVFSSDIDALVSPASLSFKYYCELVNSSQLGVNYYLNGNNYTDLASGVVSANSCFQDSNKYSFNTSDYGSLVVKPSGFRTSAGLTSQFVISTQSNGYTYYQVITVYVETTVSQLPLVKISCLVPSFCISFGEYKLFSPSNQMIFESTVSDVSPLIDSMQYTWSVFKNTGNTTNPIWTSITMTEKSYLTGGDSTELTASSYLFTTNLATIEWLVKFKIVTYSSSATSLNGASFTDSMILKVNSAPYNGTCSVNLNSGIALSTYFIITCQDWADDDSVVIKYEYFATFKNNVSTVNLGNNQTGFFYTQFPCGLSSDSDRLYIFVQIFDSAGAITTFHIASPITVIIQASALVSTQADILSGSSSNPLVISMQSSDISVASSAIISYSASFNQASSNSTLTDSQINQAMQVNEMFVNSIANYDLTDLSSMKAASSVLSVVTSNPSLISVSTANKVGTICFQMTDNLSNSANSYSLNYIFQAAAYIVDASANAVQALNINSNPELLKNSASQQISIINTITAIAASQLSLNSSTNVQKNNINLTISRNRLDYIGESLVTDECAMESFDPCALAGKPQGNCSDKNVVTQVFSRPSSLILNSEVYTSGSRSIGVSFYDDSMIEYKVNGFSDGFRFVITRQSNNTGDFVFYPVNISNHSISSANQLQTYLTKLTTANQSVTVNLKPSDTTSIGYLFGFKYGQKVVINSTVQIFDYLQVYCPSDLTSEGGHTFYKIFYAISKNKNSDTYVSYGFRELNHTEFTAYCQNGSPKQLTTAPVMPDDSDFQAFLSKEVSTRVYGSGCYYLDESTLSYSSWGVEVLYESNQTHTYCLSNHLTEFAGGLVALPPSIDFDNVWANASFTQNLTIYLTVIIVTSLYILLFVWCRYMDWKDSKKKCVHLLKDNDPWDCYFYELLVFTGTRKDAGTDSIVSFVLCGSESETDVKELIPMRRREKTLQRGAVDSFIMSCTKSLGELDYLRIWHDNSGRQNGTQSWFLKFIIVHDLQTREKSYFICNDWLALDKSDGRLERILPIATKRQKSDLKYLMEKQTKDKLSDGHLWFSIIARPTMSSFSRTDRLTCAFVLLYLTMLMNIMYYGMASSSSGNQIVFGPFSLSQTQIAIGVMTNLIVFPPSFLILQIFRKSRPRQTRSDKLRKIVDKIVSSSKTTLPEQELEVSEEAKKKKKQFLKNITSLTLPWWFKLIGYLLSACICIVCIFFIIVRGISFGDDLCRKWLTSFLISVLTSIAFTQPIQVILLTIFFVLLFRKSNDDQDLGVDHDDDGKPINKLKFESNKKKDEWSMKPRLLRSQGLHDEYISSLRLKKQQENKAKTMLRELFLYSIFLSVLFVVAYSKTSPLSYHYQTHLQNYVVANITTIQTVEKLWSWLGSNFVSAIDGSLWYNEDSTGITSYLKDYNSLLVGNVMLRQVRVIESKCTGNKVQSGDKTCYPDYGISNYDSKNYGLDWAAYSGSSSSSSISSAFEYTSALSISSQPYAGQYASYLGGGYVFQIDTSAQNQTQIQSLLKQLQVTSWLDSRSRALFIEFTVFNVNINLFAYCVILFEILPTGSIVASYLLDPMSLYADETALVVAFGVIYMFMITFLMLKEVLKLVKQKRKYFKRVWWSCIDWLLFVFSWVAFCMYLYRLYAKSSLTSKIASNKSQVINFQTLNYWNNLMLLFLAFCCVLASIRLVKLLSFSRNINILKSVFNHVIGELVSFMVIFLILIFAFTQMMYLFVYDRNSQFKSFSRSLVTGFLMILGKFNVDSYCQDAGEIIGPLTYVIFATTIVIVLLNMFITVLSDSFSRIRQQYNVEKESSIVVAYIQNRVWPSIKDNLSQITSSLKSKKNKYAVDDEQSNKSTEYHDRIDSLFKSTSKLTKYANRIK